ncbi:histidine kinase [Calothrix sp. UHCC 0171]|uniref:histidine kinase n=1 Tax=Calothrix sp. UHCC 0171 TaxID=3110245 RepID=UPI002B1F6C25|nr:histidine kinase [Calothrix sp. UHCC 0171]MEA5573244.1 histidine kinase [Calothrix sp. UHCC 0171]
MPNNIKEQIKADLDLAKESGQLRVDRIREIVKNAVSLVANEFKEGSGDLRTLVREAVSTVIENLQERGTEMKEEVTASIEGALEAVNSKRHESIAKTQVEVQQLQAKLDEEESKIQEEVDGILAEIKQTSTAKSSQVQSAIDSAIKAIENSEEATLLKKRYAQLQAQLAIVRANLAARYGGRNEEVNSYLEDAKKWYEQARPQAETIAGKVIDKHAHLSDKLGEAGSLLARREHQVKQVLKELLMAITSLFKDKDSVENGKEVVRK